MGINCGVWKEAQLSPGPYVNILSSALSMIPVSVDIF